MIYAAILLSGCGIHKEKTRLKTDTVNELQSNAQWKWTSDWKNEDYQFKDSSSLAMVFKIRKTKGKYKTVTNYKTAV